MVVKEIMIIKGLRINKIKNEWNKLMSEKYQLIINDYGIQCTLSIESNRHVAIDFPSSSPSNKISKVCSLQKKQNHPFT